MKGNEIKIGQTVKLAGEARPMNVLGNFIDTATLVDAGWYDYDYSTRLSGWTVLDKAPTDFTFNHKARTAFWLYKTVGSLTVYTCEAPSGIVCVEKSRMYPEMLDI